MSKKTSSVSRSRKIGGGLLEGKKAVPPGGLRCHRQLFLEQLEDRRLLAVGPQLLGIQPNNSDLLDFDDPNQIRDIAPRQLRFRFDENQIFTPQQYESIFVDQIEWSIF